MAEEAAESQGRMFWAIMAGALFSSMGYGMIVYVVSLHAMSLGASTTFAGLVLAAYSGARVLVNIPAGYLGERYGYRAVIVAGSLLKAAAAIMYAASRSYWPLVLWMFVMGAGRALQWTALLASAGKLSTPATRGRVMGALASFDLLGYFPGPALGGILADRIGLQSPFVGLAFFDLVALAVTMLLLHKRRPGARAGTAGQSAAPVGRPHEMMRSRLFWLVLASQFMMFYAAGGSGTLLPLISATRCGLSTAQTGLVLTLAAGLMVISIQVSGRLFDLRLRRLVLVSGAALGLVGTLTLAQARSPLSFVAGVLLAFFGAGFIYPVLPAYTADMAGESHIGRALGMLQTVADAGNLVGPIAQGALADLARGNYSIPVYFSGSVGFIVNAVLALSEKGKRPAVGQGGDARVAG